MKYADVRCHSDSKLHHVPPLPLHFHLQLSHQCHSQPYQVIVFELASAASSVSFQCTSVSFCFLLGGSCDSSTSPWAGWNINDYNSSFWICVTWKIMKNPLGLLNLWSHWSITRMVISCYFAWWLPRCMWGKKPDNCIIYISLIWCWSYDRSSSMIRNLCRLTPSQRSCWIPSD